MPSGKPALPDGASAHKAGAPEFVGAQEGAAADILHVEFRAELCELPQVERAYLCKLRYPGSERVGAAVCLACSSGEDLHVVESLAARIRRNLAAGSRIDILFLSPSLESRLAVVCRPFYSRD